MAASAARTAVRDKQAGRLSDAGHSMTWRIDAVRQRLCGTPLPGNLPSLRRPGRMLRPRPRVACGSRSAEPAQVPWRQHHPLLPWTALMDRLKHQAATQLRRNGHRMRWQFRRHLGYWSGRCRRCGGHVSVSAGYVAPDVCNWVCRRWS
jgi:hypothetical protein